MISKRPYTNFNDLVVEGGVNTYCVSSFKLSYQDYLAVHHSARSGSDFAFFMVYDVDFLKRLIQVFHVESF